MTLIAPWPCSLRTSPARTRVYPSSAFLGEVGSRALRDPGDRPQDCNPPHPECAHCAHIPTSPLRTPPGRGKPQPHRRHRNDALAGAARVRFCQSLGCRHCTSNLRKYNCNLHPLFYSRRPVKTENLQGECSEGVTPRFAPPRQSILPGELGLLPMCQRLHFSRLLCAFRCKIATPYCNSVPAQLMFVIPAMTAGCGTERASDPLYSTHIL
jgi:hypothetical protein